MGFALTNLSNACQRFINIHKLHALVKYYLLFTDVWFGMNTNTGGSECTCVVLLNKGI